ncbi:MAG: nitrogenase component 1 [Atopobiaceae bacterium]|jgi:nitrogenase molybdenum-iron protein alpha chain|nr:hypothetical protein [Atopobiaceae bacterium]MCH4180308.1 hypothetical protein [Atopobiaceae bacterium]MCH4214882.1 hypothetical protein [Atopobiaceae bacterium]MCH4229319.1 hypothetical protein [Atopobiaceae bacterium]MCH4276374.1 hypothetical protein [Atopobiaceae bacterium]
MPAQGINLELAAVPVREVRINSVTSYQGSAADLVHDARQGCVKDSGRSFSQCLGCSTTKAACMTVLIQDGAVISHGPVGCSSCLSGYDFTYRVNAPLRGVKHPTTRHIYSTNLKETDTVYGGGAKLARTIREAYERSGHPHAIFVLTTCAAGIIGDDVESICSEAEERIGVPVVAIFCEGFRSKVWTSGFDAAYHGIARKLIKPARERRDFVNVINFWGSDVFGKWLEPFGVKPNYITPYSTVNTLEHASEARATIQACSSLGSYLGAVLEQDFGVPEVQTAPPYGIRQTERWFEELGRILGQPDVAARVVEERRERYLPQIEELRHQLAGKRAYVAAGASHGHALIAVLRELGLDVAGTFIFHHDVTYDNHNTEADLLGHDVSDYGDIPHYNVCNKQEYELVNMLSRLRPDVFIARHGGMTLWGARFGIPTLLIGDEHYMMGYEGLVRYGRRLVETVENDEFVENLSQHAINPYTKWWYEQPTDTFLKGGASR